MSDNKIKADGWDVFFVALFAFIFGLGIGSCVDGGEKETRAEAVRAGAAHYDQKDGSFRWGPP